MDVELLYDPSEFYSPFDVRAESSLTEEDKRYLLPLGIFNKDGAEILIAAPVGDEEGWVCRELPETFECGEFHMTYSFKDGKWSKDAPLEKMSVVDKDSPYWFYLEAEESLRKSKEFYLKNGFLQHLTDQEPNPDRKSELFRLNDVPVTDSNWYRGQAFPVPHLLSDVKTKYGDKKLVPFFDKEGNEFKHIGNVETFHYSKKITAYLWFYFESLNKRVLVIAEYS